LDAGVRPRSSLTDAELVEGIRKAEEACFNELYARYFQRIYNFTVVRIRNRADAEEVVQETFAAVFRSVGAFRGESQLLTWIFGVARNTINNHLRRIRAEGERLGAVDAEALQPAASIGSCGPDEQLVLRRYVRTIQDQLASVSEWQVDVFRFRHEDNLSIREIAKRTGRTADAVRSSLYRVKRLLVDAIEAQRGGDQGGPDWSPA
jgi:RNA polymerase sigma-70 factor (ECF subfamily)